MESMKVTLARTPGNGEHEVWTYFLANPFYVGGLKIKSLVYLQNMTEKDELVSYPLEIFFLLFCFEIGSSEYQNTIEIPV